MSKSNTKSTKSSKSTITVKGNAMSKNVKLATATVSKEQVKGAVQAKLTTAQLKGIDKTKLAAAVKGVVVHKKAAAEKAAKGTPRTASRLGKFMASVEGKKLTINPSANPKHGKSAKRFAAYKAGMTAAQAIAAGLFAADLEWDSRPTHSFYQGDKKVVKAAYISWK